MLKHTNIFFDFDGTLSDTSDGVFKSFDYVADFYGISLADKSIYKTMIGPPLLESFTRVFGFTGDTLPQAMAKYREYYTAKGMFECRIYDGVIDLIKELRKEGKRILVATSKPEVYARQILEKKGILDLFDFVGGSDLEEAVRVNKVDIIRYVMQNLNIQDTSSCLMIGDTHFDIQGAQKAGIESLGILWGFGSEQSLRSAGATYIAKTPLDVQKLILGESA